MRTPRTSTLALALAVGWLSGHYTFNPNWPTTSTSSLPIRYKSGLLYSYASASTITVSTGKCRDSADAADMTLSSVLTLDKSVSGAINGTDEKDSGTTATTHGTATFEPAASIVGALGTRAATQTSFSSSTVTVTGVGTKFLTEVSVRDLVGNSSKGYSRVTAIASDTVLTIVAALPGGDAGGGSTGLVVIENATIWPGATAGDRSSINTLSADGLSVVLPAVTTSNAAGVSLKVGGIPNTLIAQWLNVWLVSGGSGTGGILSTQRTTPYGISGYTTSKRRIGSVLVNNNAVGNFDAAYQREVSSFIVETIYEDPVSSPSATILSAGASNGSWVAVVGSTVLPPFARQALLCVRHKGGTISSPSLIRERNAGLSTLSRPNLIYNSVASQSNTYIAWFNCDGAQCFDYTDIGGGSSMDLSVCGYRETL